MEWRPRHSTRWNRFCTTALKQFLPKLELSGGRDMAEAHRHELQSLLGDNRVSAVKRSRAVSQNRPKLLDYCFFLSEVTVFIF